MFLREYARTQKWAGISETGFRSDGLEAAAMRVPGAVRMTAADGYSMLLRDVLISLTSKTVVGTGGVSGAIPAGTFSADQLEADLDARTVALQGNARLRMIPGRLRMP